VRKLRKNEKISLKEGFMGVARFTLQGNTGLEDVLKDIRSTANLTDGERRRRELDIEIAISEAIKTLLGIGAVTSANIQNAVQNQVLAAYNGWKAQGAVAAQWPFPRQ
jgi:hypothetical protein